MQRLLRTLQHLIVETRCFLGSANASLQSTFPHISPLSCCYRLHHLLRETFAKDLFGAGLDEGLDPGAPLVRCRRLAPDLILNLPHAGTKISFHLVQLALRASDQLSVAPGLVEVGKDGPAGDGAGHLPHQLCHCFTLLSSSLVQHPLPILCQAAVPYDCVQSDWLESPAPDLTAQRWRCHPDDCEERRHQQLKLHFGMIFFWPLMVLFWKIDLNWCPKKQWAEDIFAWKVLDGWRLSRSALKFPWNEGCWRPIPVAAKLVPAGILAITAMNGLSWKLPPSVETSLCGLDMKCGTPNVDQGAKLENECKKPWLFIDICRGTNPALFSAQLCC